MAEFASIYNGVAGTKFDDPFAFKGLIDLNNDIQQTLKADSEYVLTLGAAVPVNVGQILSAKTIFIRSDNPIWVFLNGAIVNPLPCDPVLVLTNSGLDVTSAISAISIQRMKSVNTTVQIGIRA